MDEMEPKLKLTVLLRSLGNTATEVADKLQKLGITGTFGSTDCPIANYLTRNCGYRFAAVSSNSMVCLDKDYKFPEYIRVSDVPEPVSEFIREFDMFRHENLRQKGVSHATD